MPSESEPELREEEAEAACEAGSGEEWADELREMQARHSEQQARQEQARFRQEWGRQRAGAAAAPPEWQNEFAEREANEIEEGIGAFVDPGDLKVGKWYTIEFAVGPDEAAIARETEGQKLTEARQIYVAPTMRVTLLDDPNFEAKAKTPDVQETGTDRAATWQWSLRPLLPGKHTLYARVEVLQRAQNGELSSVESYTRRVAIVVKSGMWNNSVGAMEKATSLGDLLGKLFGSWRGALAALTLLIGAAVALWAAITKL